MFKTKLLQALKTLNARERLRWRAFVFSDFSNRNADLRVLCEILMKAAPEFSSPELEKEQVFKAVFGETEKYNELKINNLISDLLVLLYEFWAWSAFKNRADLNKPILLDQLMERGLTSHAPEILQRFEQLHLREKERSAAWQRSEVVFYEKAERLSQQSARRDFDPNLQQLGDAIDLAFVLEKLRVACEMLSRNSLSVKSSTYRIEFLDDVKRWCLENPELGKKPAVQVFLSAIFLLENSQTADYQKFKDALAKHSEIFPKDELSAFHTIALNFCIRQINAGRVDWYAETLDLYKTLLAEGTILQNGFLSQWSYKNIATAGLRSGEFEWTENFIRDWRGKLPLADRENAFAYNLAALFFEKKEFQNALFALQNVEFTDQSYHIGAKIIQLKSYFTLGEGEALLSLADATEKFLRRNRHLSNYGKTANLNFLKLLRRVFQLRIEGLAIGRKSLESRVGQLKSLISETQPLANKDWLVEVLS